MKYLRFLFVIFTFLASAPAYAAVTLYPWPTNAPISDKYAVNVYQNNVDCERYSPPALYSEPVLTQGPDGDGVTGLFEDRSLTYVPFSFDGTIEVEVTKLFGTAATHVEVSPKSYGIEPSYFNGTTVRFALDHLHKPAYISVNFVTADNQDPNNNGAISIKHGVIIFADEHETGAPDLSQAVNYVDASRSEIENAALLYFPAGDHRLIEKFDRVNGEPGTDARIYIKNNNQQIYLAPGAIVRGSIDADGHDNLKVFGRGIFTGEDFYWHYFQEPGSAKGKTAFLAFSGSHDTEFYDFIVVNPTHHTMPSGQNNTIKNVKIIGWASNHDGIRPSSGSTVSEMFIKTSDDLDYARGPHSFTDSVIWPMRNGAFGQLGWNNLGTGFTTYQNIRFINSEWDMSADQKGNAGIIGSVLTAGVSLTDNLIENIYAEWGTGLLCNLSIHYNANKGWQTPVSGSWGEIKDFTFRNIIFESEFQNSGGVLTKSKIAGFERDGSKATVHDINFINVIAGNKLITDANKDTYFDIDTNTTSNINFTTQGNIYTVTATANAGGTLRPSGAIPTPEGMDRYISVIPDAGNRIIDVVVDGDSIGRRQNIYLPNISADHTVNVTFAAGTDHFGGTFCTSPVQQPTPSTPVSSNPDPDPGPNPDPDPNSGTTPAQDPAPGSGGGGGSVGISQLLILGWAILICRRRRKILT